MKAGTRRKPLHWLSFAAALALASPALAAPAAPVQEAKPAADKAAAAKKKPAKPAATTAATKPGPAKPAAAKPAAKSDATKSEATKPQAAKPGTKPEAAKPQVAKPGTKPAATTTAKTTTAKPTAAKTTAPKPASKPEPAKASKPAAAKTATAKPTGTPSPAASKASRAEPGTSIAARPPAAAPVPPRAPARPATPMALAPTTSTSAADVATVRRAIELVRARKTSEANALKSSISDPLARKLIEWAILRSDNASADFARYASFIAATPCWPSLVTFRRRAEAMLYVERPSPATVRAYFDNSKPLSAKGRIALARALLAQGDRSGAEELVRDVWRHESLPADLESQILESYGEFLTRADHKARMDRMLYDDDNSDAGLRAANRLGGNEPAIAKARIAMLGKGANNALLDAVPAAARNDIGYKFARIQALRRGDHIAEAAELMMTIPKQLDRHHDADQWWIERRLLARKLLDVGDPKTAYIVARDATTPERENYRAEHQFTAGWIAMRFLNDPATAYAHFQRIGDGHENPIALSRASYWQGRAAEALRRPQEARAHYQEAARYPTAYYGQIARAKAGLGEINISPTPAFSAEQRARLSQLEVVRAVELLYAIDARELVNIMMADIGDKADDVGAMHMLAELAQKNNDARAMLLLGKLALGRGHRTEHAAFPTLGLPKYTAIGPEAEPAIVYSIARQESWFNPKTISSAKAMGLMQVTPAAGKYIAKKFGVTFDEKRLLSDNVYNVQMGAAEIGDVIKDYRGSYILAFAAYNAGRGRVKEWVARFGDPRDPNVDPIDWVERIPFAETRNYVQRVMENVQVYRVRFGGSQRLLIEADLRRGALN